MSKELITSLKAMWLSDVEHPIEKRRLFLLKLSKSLSPGWSLSAWRKDSEFAQKKDKGFYHFSLWCGDFAGGIKALWEKEPLTGQSFRIGFAKKCLQRYGEGWSHVVWKSFYPSKKAHPDHLLFNTFIFAVWSYDFNEITRLINKDGKRLSKIFNALSQQKKILLERDLYSYLSTCKNSQLKSYAFEYDKQGDESHVLAKILNSNLLYRLKQCWDNKEERYSFSQQHRDILTSLSSKKHRWSLTACKALFSSHKDELPAGDPLYLIRSLEFSAWCFDFPSVKLLIEKCGDILIKKFKLVSPNLMVLLLENLCESIINSHSLDFMRYAIQCNEQGERSNFLSMIMHETYNFQGDDGLIIPFCAATKIRNKLWEYKKEHQLQNSLPLFIQTPTA